MDEPISNILSKEQGKLLTIYGYPVVQKYAVLEISMYFYVLYCLCYVEERYQLICSRNRCRKRGIGN